MNSVARRLSGVELPDLNRHWPVRRPGGLRISGVANHVVQKKITTLWCKSTGVRTTRYVGSNLVRSNTHWPSWFIRRRYGGMKSILYGQLSRIIFVESSADGLPSRASAAQLLDSAVAARLLATIFPDGMNN